MDADVDQQHRGRDSLKKHNGERDAINNKEDYFNLIDSMFIS